LDALWVHDPSLASPVARERRDERWDERQVKLRRQSVDPTESGLLEKYVGL